MTPSLSGTMESGSRKAGAPTAHEEGKEKYPFKQQALLRTKALLLFFALGDLASDVIFFSPD